MDYVPLSSFDDLPSPHAPEPKRRTPPHVWLIACAPIPTLITLILWLPVLVLILVVLATAGGSVALAKDWRAAIPVVYLLARAARTGTLWPLILNLALGFATTYYVLLFLAAIVSIVNRS